MPASVTSMLVRGRHVVAGLGLVLLVSANAFAQVVPAPACYFGFVGDLRKAIADAAEADDFFLMIGKYQLRALRGTADTLKFVGGERFWSTFQRLDALRTQGRNPFLDDEAMFDVVGGLAERQVAGLDTTLIRVTGETDEGFLTGQGAVFDLYVARKIADDGAAYQKVSGLEVLVEQNGVARRYDIVDTGGIRHENKSWTQGLPLENSPAFDTFLSQFRADVRIDGIAGFTLTRYNFPSVISAHMETLKSRLLAEFDPDKELAGVLTEAQLSRAREAFLALWDNGTLWDVY